MFKKSFLIVLLMALIFNGSHINALNSQQEETIELNQSNFIDKIEVSPNDLYHGQNTRITVYFSEKSNVKLTSNSIVTLTSPTDLMVFNIDENDPLEIIFNGVVVGYVHTRRSGEEIVMTFNDKVNDAYDHKGSFYLSAKSNFSNPSQEVNVKQVREYETTLGSDAPKADYKINYTYTVGSSPFFYKPSGAIWTSDPAHVNWWLHANRDQKNFLSDLEVVDTIHSGQVFEVLDPSQGFTLDNINPTFFKITVEAQGQSEVLSPKEFVEKGLGSFEVLAEDSFKITFFQQAALPNNEYTVHYKTKITPEGKYQPFFYNDAIGTYEEDGKRIVKEQLNKEAENIFSGGIIAPEKGSLRIVKLAKNQELTQTLPGATFKLFYEDGREVDSGNDKGVFETQANGQVNTPPLDPGKYYVTELSAPDFVDFDPTIKYPFEMKLDDNYGVQLVISNDVKRTNIEVRKIWDDQVATHPDILVDLLADGIKIDEVVLSDSKLSHTFMDLAKYQVDGTPIVYSVEEQEVQGYTSVVNGDAETGFTVVNTPIIIKGVLEAEKRVSQKQVNIGETFTYTIIVRNTKEGSQALKNIEVEDILPDGINFKDQEVLVNGVKVDAMFSNQSVSLRLDSVVYGTDYEISFNVVADGSETGELINKATVLDPENPTDPEEPEVPVTVIPKGKLKATKTVSKEDVRPLEPFTYTITVENTVKDSEPLTNVTVSDKLPEGIVFSDRVVYVDGVVVEALVIDDLFRLTLDEVHYGNQRVITFKAQALSNTTGVRTNKAVVTNPEDPENPEEPEAPVTVIPEGNLEAEKLVSQKEVKPNEIFTYSILVRNSVKDSSVLKDVVLRDKLPNDIVFVDDHIYVNGEKTSAQVVNNEFELLLPDIAYGEDVVVSFDVKAQTNSFGERVNKAQVVNPEDPDHPLEPEVPVTIVPQGRIAADKKVSEKEVEAGESFEYQIIVKNIVEGSKPLKNIKVIDKLPEGLKYVDKEIFVDGVKTPVIVLADSFEVVIPELAYGKEVVVSFLASAQIGVFGEKINVATVIDPEDPENPEEPEVPIEVLLDGDILAEKRVSKDIVKPEEEFEYEIVISNPVLGSEPVENVVVKDSLPKDIVFTDGVILVDGMPSNATVDGYSFELVIASLAHGNDVSITFKVKAEANSHGERMNKATVINPEDPDHPKEPEVPVTIIPDGKLDAQKLVSKTEVKPEEAFTYTIIVKNTVEGSKPLSNISVEDTLPDGLVFTDGLVYVDGVETPAVVNGQSLNVILDKVDYGLNRQISFSVKAITDIKGEFINIAKVVNPEHPTEPVEPEVPVTVIPKGKLEAEKRVSQDTVKVNEVFEYKIVVHNTEKDSYPLEAVIVKDTLPDGLVFSDQIIYVDGLASSATVFDNSFELVLDEVHYGKERVISFKVFAQEDTKGTLVNIASVVNPEDPDHPKEPEVPVIVVPEDPKNPDPSKPTAPKPDGPTVNTGIKSNQSYLFMMIVSLGFLGITKKRSKKRI